MLIIKSQVCTKRTSVAVVASLLFLIKKIWLVDRKMPPDDRSIPRTVHTGEGETDVLHLYPISVSQSYNALRPAAWDPQIEL